jgi:uncharacterized protein YbjT (DUF2867 family)
MGKTAIVVGATGLVGRALVEQLVSASHVGRVVTITRRPAAHASSKVVNTVADFEGLDDSAPVVQGDWLFSALGTTRQQAGSIEAQWHVDVDYQLAAARIAASNGVPHYLLVSSSMADANSSNAYLRMKGELEQAIPALPFRRVSIFQPALLLGARERPRAGERLAGAIMPALRVLPGLRRYRPIRGEQVAARMIGVSQSSGAGVEWFQLDEVFPG